MCGITGIYAFNPIGRIHLIHLEEATRQLSKRGPDAHGTWFDDRIGLGHRRLSIIDTSEGANQPFSDAEKRFQLVFNGEIYNYKELRSELEVKGYSFRTESDTEVLLYAYVEWKEKCLERLNGFFSFAVYNSETGQLFLARDRYGIKPLYYFKDSDKFIFASELKSLIAFGIPKKIDRLGLHLYFQHTYIPAPHTIFDKVKKLKQGHFLQVNLKEVEEKAYYEIPFKESGHPSFEESKRNLVDAMRASVKRRLIADVPLGAFLSGGIDSSIITALASEEVSDFKTFSIGFKDQQYFDETKYAQLVADRFHTDHHVYSLSNDDLLSEVQSVLDYLDEPFADSSALPVYMLSKYVRKEVTVALSGDGADELFSGYNKHAAWLMSQSNGWKTSAISALAPLWKSLPKSRGQFLMDKVRQLDRFASIRKLNPEERYWYLASFMETASIHQLIKSEHQMELERLVEFHAETFSPFESASLSESLLRDTQLVLEGDMLVKVDRMSMANGLEVRVPFLDPEVVKLAFQVPDEYKIHGMNRKYLLKEAFKEILPEELYTRPKHGFEVPLLQWFRKELRSELEKKVFNHDLIFSQGIFEWEEIQKIQKRMDSWDPGDVHIAIWSMYVFQNWYEKYFRG